MKNKFKLRHFIYLIVFLTISVVTLKLLNIITLSWFFIHLPFLLFGFGLILYIATLSVWSYFYIRRQAKILSEEEFNTELSFFCHICAKPFEKPIKHGKGETVFHKNCKSKN